MFGVKEGPGAKIGPYKLLEAIGEGGFGKVFMAEQEQPVRRKVALKIIKPGMDTAQVVARFEGERQALAMMVHPNIAQFYDGGTTESGRPYFVMELVRGVPVTHFCDHNHLQAAERLKHFVAVCQAIQHAHHKGIIHRDIKPTNVLVTLHDGVPVVKVIDFGIAKATAQRLTEKTLFTNFGQMIGTPAYMSPEQAEMSGLDMDTRTDIYSLGVLLYELLTGTTPIEQDKLRAAGYAEMQRIIREVEPPKPSHRLSSLGDTATILAANRATDPKRLSKLLAGDLDWIVMKSLEKDRNRRYATPGGFAEDVERYLRREPITARPPSTAYRLAHFARRHRGTLAIASTLALVTLIGLAVSIWQAIAATRARNAAVTATVKASAKEAETQAVLDFVDRHVFAAARPHGQAGGLGYDVSLKQALVAALDSVDASFQGQPLVEARVRQTLANSFLYLSDFTTAAQQLERARSIYMDLIGPDDSRTLAATADLANAYSALGRFPEALRLHADTFQRRTAQFGPDDPNTLTSMGDLATAYADTGDRAKALELREEVHRRQLATLGPNDLRTIAGMRNLAISYSQYRRFDEAIDLEKRALARARAILGETNPDTLHLRNNLAISYADAGRFDEALELQQETQGLLEKELGPTHRRTMLGMHNLAKALADVDSIEDALELLEKTLELQKANLPPDHPDIAQTTYSLALRHHSLNHFKDALRLHREAFALRKKLLGDDHTDTLYSMWGVGVNLLKLHKGSEAIPIIDECLRLAHGKAKSPVFSGLTDKRIRYFKEGHDAAGCRATAEIWESFHFADAGSLIQAARYRAITASVLRDTGQSPDAEIVSATAWLRQAFSAGYRDAEKLMQDKDFEILRGRPDFTKLLADIAASKAPNKD
ncbi:MAG: tetratricopeptide repeat protein [Gemmataceae bacterium]